MARSSSPFPKRTAPEADTSAPDLPAGALVPVNPRHDGWTPAKQRAFIETLADTGCITAAANAVGMSPASAYRLRRRTDARAFDAAWEAALGRAMAQLLPAAMDRALNGTVREKWYHGEVVGSETIFHEKLMIWLLEKGEAMLHHFEARRAMREDWDGTMDAIEAGESAAPKPAKDYNVWMEGYLRREEAPEEMDGGDMDGEEDEDGFMTDAADHWADCGTEGGSGAVHEWIEDVCLTNCPPPADFNLLAIGKPGDPDYTRHLTPEEEAAWRWQDTQLHRVTHYDEAARRRFFTLDDYALHKARAAARRSARRAAKRAEKAALAAALNQTAADAEAQADTAPGKPVDRAQE